MKFIKNVAQWDYLKGMFYRNLGRRYESFILSEHFIEETFCDTHDGFSVVKTAGQNFLNSCKQHGFNAVFDQYHGWWVVTRGQPTPPSHKPSSTEAV